MTIRRILATLLIFFAQPYEISFGSEDTTAQAQIQSNTRKFDSESVFEQGEGEKSAYDMPISQSPWLYEDQYILSIATGFDQPIAKAPVVASLITADTIKAMGASEIDEILESVPGLHVSRSPIGYNPIYSFRGVHTAFNPQVLMLIDNIPITNLFHGDRNTVWGGMPVEAISRIEVIRGPGSALYGADAFAGVINIITKTPEEVGAGELGLRIGDFGTRGLWLSRSGSVGELALSVILELNKTQGSNALITADAQTWLDRVADTNASMAPQQVNLSRNNLDLRTYAVYRGLTVRAGLQSRSNWGDGAGVAQAVNPDNKFSSRRYNIDLHYRKLDLFPQLELESRLSYFRTTQEVEGNLVLYPSGSSGPFFGTNNSSLSVDEQGQYDIFEFGVIGNPELFEKHKRISFAANYTGLEDHQLSLGVGYYIGHIDQVRESKNFAVPPGYDRFINRNGIQLYDVTDTHLAFMPEVRRENRYLFLQDSWQLANDWELTAGVRSDSYSDFGSTINPRFALVWANSYRLTTKLLYGEAFRAPSFAETQEVNNPVALGNPNLRPEKMKSFELAFDYRWDIDDAITINFFYYDWNDIILYKPDAGSSTVTAQNTGRQDGYGLELDFTRPLSENLQLNANFAWQRSKDQLNYADAADTPERQFYINARWQQNNWHFSLQGHWVMKRNRSPFDSRSAVKDYLKVDLTARRVFSRHVEMALQVNNLLHEEILEPSPNAEPSPFIVNDLPLPGRSVSAEVRFLF